MLHCHCKRRPHRGLGAPALLWALLALPIFVAAPWAATTVQISDDSTGSCSSFQPSLSADGSMVVFDSDCDPLGSNSDGNREIFIVDKDDWSAQITTSSSCFNGSPALSADATAVVFESDCDLTGANEDASFEIFSFDSMGLAQLTDGDSCSSFAPSVSADATAVVFESDCDLTGGNSDLSSEIFSVTLAGVLTSLTDDSSGSLCGSHGPSVNSDGSVVAFESDCDLAGSNSEELLEIFTVDGQGTVEQMTVSGEDDCSSFDAAVSGDGSQVVFASNCDFAGTNADGGDEVFRVDSLGAVEQLTDSSSAACDSGAASVDDGGDIVAFDGFCDPLGENTDGSLEVFFLDDGGVQQLTEGTSCSADAPSLSADGNGVAFVSDCDLTGANGDGGDEIFFLSFCSCGTPASGLGPDAATSTDALITLKAAVGLTTCALCECDVNDDEAVNATDALLILKKSVELDVTFDCP